MNLQSGKAACLAAALALLVATVAAPQGPVSQDSRADATAARPKTSPAADQAKLAEATRVSTEEAARQAAQKKSKEQIGKTATPKDSDKNSPSGVSELQPVPKTAGDSGSAVRLPSEDAGASPLKNIHGSVRGASGAGAREGGAEIGADKKNGKTHLYVETERSRTSPATPH